MGKKTIKIGDEVVLGCGHRSKVTHIICGSYVLAKGKPGTMNRYTASQLKSHSGPTPQLKRSAPIKKSPGKIKSVGNKRSILNKVYKILRDKFLKERRTCAAKISGCTKNATEVHHQCGRENLLLIMTKWFLPVCRNCHNVITEYSDKAIELKLSFPKKLVRESDLSEEETTLLEQHGYFERKIVCKKNGNYILIYPNNEK